MWTALLAATSFAHAGMLTPKWSPATPVTYQTQTYIQVANGFRFFSLNNLDARALETAVSARFTCKGEPSGKNFELVCSVDDINIDGVAVATEQEKLNKIFAEHEETLKKATIELVLKPDGSFKMLDLEGVDKKYERGNDVHEQLRQLMRRVLAPLDASMPKKGEDPGRAWRHRGQPAFIDLFVTQGTDSAVYGTTGGSRVEYSIIGEHEGYTVMEGPITANVTTIIEREAGAGLGINLVGATSLAFDPKSGLLDFAAVGLSGEYNANATVVGNVPAYAYAGEVARVRADGSVVKAPPSGGGKAAPPQ